jgi:hypothetical protein
MNLSLATHGPAPDTDTDTDTEPVRVVASDDADARMQNRGISLTASR